MFGSDQIFVAALKPQFNILTCRFLLLIDIRLHSLSLLTLYVPKIAKWPTDLTSLFRSVNLTITGNQKIKAPSTVQQIA